MRMVFVTCLALLRALTRLGDHAQESVTPLAQRGSDLDDTQEKLSRFDITDSASCACRQCGPSLLEHRSLSYKLASEGGSKRCARTRKALEGLDKRVADAAEQALAALPEEEKSGYAELEGIRTAADRQALERWLRQVAPPLGARWRRGTDGGWLLIVREPSALSSAAIQGAFLEMAQRLGAGL